MHVQEDHEAAAVMRDRQMLLAAVSPLHGATAALKLAFPSEPRVSDRCWNEMERWRAWEKTVPKPVPPPTPPSALSQFESAIWRAYGEALPPAYRAICL